VVEELRSHRASLYYLLRVAAQARAPLIVLVFGLGLASKVATATALTIVVSTLTTYAGVKAIDPDGERLFYSLGATRMQVFRKLVIPSCLP
jgi:NitT/TauT family transport system permease protein